jgi:hypothetical protein
MPLRYAALMKYNIGVLRPGGRSRRAFFSSRPRPLTARAPKHVHLLQFQAGIPMRAKPLPSAEYLRATFRYDRRTGQLYWRWRADVNRVCNARFAGRPAGTRLGAQVGVTLKGYGVVRAHRIIWKMIHDQEPEEIDHRDRDPSNNRLANLRPATRVQNVRNRRMPPGASGYPGVSLRHGRWLARITVDGREVRLGSFDDPAKANRAYRRAARRYFGEFAPRDG